MAETVETIADLVSVVGKTPPAIALKVIDHLDAPALDWLRQSPLMFAGFGDGDGIGITLGGGRSGFAGGDRQSLRLPLTLLDDPALAAPGAAFGSLFLAPGIGETLRVNGRVTALADGEAVIVVEQCYVHCAKALIRSAFWTAKPDEPVPDDPAGFAAASRFMALATVDAEGGADVSPKGDPAGSMVRIEGGDLWFADRPGNRRVDSFRNILSRPRIAAALLVPGSRRIVSVRGVARLTTADTACAPFAVNGKTPRLAVQVQHLSLELRTSAALERASLWPLRDPAELDPAQMFIAHVKANRDKGLGAKVAGAMVSIPGLLQKSLDQDYKSNLY